MSSLLKDLLRPLGNPKNLLLSVPRYVRFLFEWRQYASLDSHRISLANLRPCLGDRTATTGIDAHYFYQGVWAFRKIIQAKPTRHVDVGSQVDFGAYLSSVVLVTFMDIRPLVVQLDGLECRSGSILHLPYEDQELPSLSCLHVIEHIGLGRYGDPLDPEGTVKACVELGRVVKPGGSLYLSTPVGQERVCFNAHRVHHPSSIRNFLNSMELVEFSMVDDAGQFRSDASLEEAGLQQYACGLFHFKKR